MLRIKTSALDCPLTDALFIQSSTVILQLYHQRTTTLAGARATLLALRNSDNQEVNRLQDLHKELRGEKSA